MKKRNKIQWALTLAALPFLATAAASAHQWISTNSLIEAPVIATDGTQVSARVHNIVLNRNGGIEGRVTNINEDQGKGLSSLKVYFVREGEIAQETTTDENGKFHIANMVEGAYSFVATGESGFAAYGVNVVSYAPGAATNIMEAAAVSPHFSVVKRILTDNLPSQIVDEIVAGSSSNITDEMVGSNRIKLDNGTLRGNLIPLFGEIRNIEGTNIHIIRNDEQVAEVQASATGSFSVANLEPGVYDFVAAGPTGIAAVSFQAIEGEIASVIDSDEIPVAIEPAAAAAALPYQDFVTADIPFDAASSLDVCTTCQADAGFVGEQVSFAGDPVFDTGYEASPIEFASESVSLGGACGGSCGQAADFSGFSSCNTCNSCCGGGGGVGGRLFGGRLGGTGLRRLLLLGGIAGAVVAIASDDDDEQTPGAPF